MCLAQDTTVLRNWNALELNMNSAAGLGTTTLSGVRYPQGSTKTALKGLHFWVTGIVNGDTLCIAANPYKNRSDWREGPAPLSGNPGLARQKWGRIWALNSTAIQYHKAHYTETNYAAIRDISRWPGRFQESGFPQRIAPFVDFDLNNLYTPGTGDFPYLPGGEIVFSTGADSMEKGNFKTQPMAADLSAMWFLPDGPLPENTAFVRYTLCNRGSNTISNLSLSALLDGQIGSATDDYMATNVTRNALIMLNAGAPDAVYGNSPPALAFAWLNSSASSSLYFNAGNDNVNGEPTKPAHFYYLANAHWKTGKTLTYGGSGLDGTVPARYIYPGNTDTASPIGNWTDEIDGPGPGKRSGLLNLNGMALSSGQCRVFDAHITVMPDRPSVGRMDSTLAGVRKYYDGLGVTLGTKDQASTGDLFYPNPLMQGQLLYALPGKNGIPFRILDASGKTVFLLPNGIDQKGWKSDLAPGLYFILQDGPGMHAQKLLVE